MRILLNCILLLSLFSGCKAFVNTSIDAQGNTQKEWSGTIPPLYWQWTDEDSDNQNHLLFPLAYWDEDTFITPIYGNDSPSNYSFYLTPLISKTSPAGVDKFLLFPFSYRHIDLSVQKKAKSSFDFSFWPLFSFQEPVRENDILIEQDYLLSTPLLPAYCNFIMNVEHKNDSINTQSKTIGFLYNSTTMQQKELLIINETNALNFKREQESQITLYIPLLFNYKSNILMSTDSISYHLDEKWNVVFPFWFEKSDLGNVPELDDVEKNLRSKHVDNHSLIIFPFVSYENKKGSKRFVSFMFTYIQKEMPDYDYFSQRILWFYEYKSRKNDWALELFFIPIVSFNQPTEKERP